MADLLEIADLRLQFNSMRGTVKALDGVNLTVREREIIGLVGESGCGKTITGLSVLGLLPRPQTEVTSGEILFRGEDLLLLDDREVASDARPSRRDGLPGPARLAQPGVHVGNQISRVIRVHKDVSPAGGARRDAHARCAGPACPATTSCSTATRTSSRGGMRQRACMAMALSCDAPLLIADEPTTALDVTIQAQILRLLLDLRDELGVAQILITHNVGVAAQTCDRVAVMYAGTVVEQGRTVEVLKHPRHPYTMALYECLPQGKSASELRTIPGSVPDLIDPPAGCRFHPRCAHAMDVCETVKPEPTHADRRALGRLPLGRAAARRRRRERRRDARCSRSQDLTVHFRIKTRPLEEVGADVVHAVDDVSFTIAARRDAGAGRRVGLGQDDGRPSRPSASTRRRPARIAFEGRDLDGAQGRRAARGDARRAGRLPGPVLLAEPAHDRARRHRRAAARARRR